MFFLDSGLDTICVASFKNEEIQGGGRVMLRIRFLALIIFIFLVFGKSLLIRGACFGGSRPNFIFILADDLGWGYVRCYRNRLVRTPNLDRLVAHAILFTQFYVNSSVCSPSRAAFMTGRFPARFAIHGHFATHQQNKRRGMPNWLSPNVPTITRILETAGYVIGHFVKWHLGGGSGAPEPFGYGIDECKINVGNEPKLDFGPKERAASSEVIINETIRFIERNRKRPFYV